MKLKCYPVRYDGYSEDGELVFSVEAIDEFASNVTIKSIVDPDLWGLVADHVAECLAAMHPKETQ